MAHSAPRRLSVPAAMTYLSTVSLLTTAAMQRTDQLDPRSSREALGERFSSFLARVTAEPDSAARRRIVAAFTERLAAYGRAVVEESTVTFVYTGEAQRVAVPGDLNGWSATADTMTQVPGTDLFFLTKEVPQAARFEYKFVVDSVWILDPFNRQQAMGGFGPNSEVWMPSYRAPEEVRPRADVPRGRIDTLLIPARRLGRTHPVLVYLPAGYERGGPYPSITVMDGGEYLTLGLMHIVLDNLIADRRIAPLVGIFVDPRTDPDDPATSMRMHDYALSDTFVAYLTDDVLPLVRNIYRITPDAGQTAVMGASLGGLIATYAALTRPDVFGLCAAQSPSYYWKEDAMIALVRSLPKRDVRISIDTGTIRDAQEGARRMKAALEERGYRFSYAEYPEGHNWVNWRARIDDILVTFWGEPP